ncbi:MAG TPA: hypothetical protein VER76_18755 [Pyrinomonadaceae bacterium]|nr:hypothetical protein [Pyrinomonadaceae bacterium]
MSTNESVAQAGVAKAAPTEQQASKPGAPKRFEKGQTVCNEKDAKGKLHNGHLKQVSPIREDARQHMRGDDLLYRCQTCGALYMGPPLGHVRDPRKQARYVQSELVQILEAAGGTLPAFKQNESGAWVPASDTTQHAPAPVAAAAQNIKPATAAAAKPASSTPAAAAASGDETPEQKRARIIAEAKAKAAARMAGGGAAATNATTSEPPKATPPPTAATAAATGDAPEGETPEERRARIMAEAKAKAAARMAAAKGETSAGSADASATAASKTVNAPAEASASGAPPTLAVAPDDDSPEAKRARMMAEIKAKAAAKMAAKGGAKTGGETSIAMPPTTAQPPSPTSGTDSSQAADAHRPAAEAQAATGQASAAPMSPAAATASPAAGAETPADLAPDASTELTPGAPRDERAANEGTTE